MLFTSRDKRGKRMHNSEHGSSRENRRKLTSKRRLRRTGKYPSLLSLIF